MNVKWNNNNNTHKKTLKSTFIIKVIKTHIFSLVKLLAIRSRLEMFSFVLIWITNLYVNRYRIEFRCKLKHRYGMFWNNKNTWQSMKVPPNISLNTTCRHALFLELDIIPPHCRMLVLQKPTQIGAIPENLC